MGTGTVTASMQEQYNKVVKERDELRAHCERLLGAKLSLDASGYWDGDRFSTPYSESDRFDEAFETTPAQSLAEIKAQAIEEMLNHFQSSPIKKYIMCDAAWKYLQDYAQQLRKGEEHGS